MRAVFTFHWFDPKTGVERPLVTRTAVFMVPQTETTTWFHIFLFSRIGSSFYRLLKPLVHATTRLIGKRDVRNDADWVVHVADTPLELDGMRLGKFDKPVIRNRRFLHTIYWGRPFPRTSASPGIPSKTGEV